MSPNELGAEGSAGASTIYVVEDDPAQRASLTYALEAAGHHPQSFLAAEAFLAAVDPVRAEGCLLVDLHLPGMSGLELVEEVARRGSPMRMIVMTAYGGVSDAVRAMRSGACDFLEKPFKPDEIVNAVTRTLGGRQPDHAWRAEASSAAARLALLSLREREVVNGLVAGLLGKQVAHRLGISARTVEVHRANAMRRLGVRTLPELVRLALLAEFAHGPSR